MAPDMQPVSDEIAAEVANEAGIDAGMFFELITLARASSRSLRRDGFADRVSELIDRISAPGTFRADS